mgnify:CR=1 FL=1
MQFLKVSCCESPCICEERPHASDIFANDLELLAYNGEYNVSDTGTNAPPSHFGTGELTKFKQQPLPRGHGQENWLAMRLRRKRQHRKRPQDRRLRLVVALQHRQACLAVCRGILLR